MPMSAAVSCHGAFRTPQTSSTKDRCQVKPQQQQAPRETPHLSPLLLPGHDVTLNVSEKQPQTQRRVRFVSRAVPSDDHEHHMDRTVCFLVFTQTLM